MKRTALIFFVILALAASASAQSKFSGTAKCGKLEKDFRIEVGDQPGHVFQLILVKCPYLKGEIAGVQVKEEIDTGFYDISKDSATGRLSGFMNMSNGDKTYVGAEATMVLKNGAPQTENGKWNISGGTGKFTHLKGKGTYKATFAADGTATVEVQGEYEFAK